MNTNCLLFLWLFILRISVIHFAIEVFIAHRIIYRDIIWTVSLWWWCSCEQYFFKYSYKNVATNNSKALFKRQSFPFLSSNVDNTEVYEYSQISNWTCDPLLWNAGINEHFPKQISWQFSISCRSTDQTVKNIFFLLCFKQICSSKHPLNSNNVFIFILFRSTSTCMSWQFHQG